MQVVSLPDARGSCAVASRKIAAGELVHVAAPLVYLSTRAAPIHLCIGCLAPISSSTSKGSCEGGCGRSFCSAPCEQRAQPFHFSSGECAVLYVSEKIGGHGLKSNNHDLFHLQIVAQIIARGLSEGYSLPLRSPTGAADTGSSAAVAASDADVSRAAAAAVTEEPSSKAMREPPQVAVDEKNKSKKQQHQQQQRTNSSSGSSSSDDEEEEAEEEEVAPLPTQKGRKFRKNQQHKQKQHLNKNKKKTSGNKPRLPARGIADGCSSQPTEASRLQADIRLCSSHKRSSIFTAFPELKEQSEKLRAASVSSASSSSLKWQLPPLENHMITQHPGGNADDMRQLADAMARQQVAEEKAVPQDFADFCDLISNREILQKSELGRYETLRRKFEAMLAKLDQSNPPPALRKFFPAQPLDQHFFYDVCSAYRCNSFGVFDGGDEQQGLCVYPSASFWNHACKPNLGRRQHGKIAAFYALREIGKGEDLTISYVDGFSRATARREHLLEHYRFWCHCSVCAPESHDLTGAGSAPNLDKCEKCFASGFLRSVLDPDSGTLLGKECETCFWFSAAAVKKDVDDDDDD